MSGGSSPYEREKARIRFVVERDGTEEAKIFCERGLKLYRQALVQPYAREFKNDLTGSIRAYCEFIDNFQ